MLFCLLLGVLATLIAFPESPVGRSLHRLLVEPLAHRLSRIRPGHVLFAAILTAVATAMILLFEGEGLRLIGMAGPEVVTWLGMFDAAAVLDLAAVALAMAATMRLKAVRDRVLALAGQAVATARLVLRSGRRRSRRNRPTGPLQTRSDDPAPAAWNGYAFG